MNQTIKSGCYFHSFNLLSRDWLLLSLKSFVRILFFALLISCVWFFPKMI